MHLEEQGLVKNQSSMNVIERFCKIYTDLCKVSSDDLATIYGRDVVFIDPITTHKGLADVQHYFSNLLTQADSCKFDIATIATCSGVYGSGYEAPFTHVANWTMTLTLKKGQKVITLDGTTQLKVENDIITYHKDYYDLGEMVYEHIPVLGFVIKKIKKSMSS
jgi:hypothetical protein